MLLDTRALVLLWLLLHGDWQVPCPSGKLSLRCGQVALWAGCAYGMEDKMLYDVCDMFYKLLGGYERPSLCSKGPASLERPRCPPSQVEQHWISSTAMYETVHAMLNSVCNRDGLVLTMIPSSDFDRFRQPAAGPQPKRLGKRW